MQFRPWPMAVFFVSLSVVGLAVSATCGQQQSKRVRASGSDGFVSILDGKTLDGWHTLPKESAPDWTVQDGVIVGQGIVTHRSYLVWKDAHLADFELELRYRLPAKVTRESIMKSIAESIKGTRPSAIQKKGRHCVQSRSHRSWLHRRRRPGFGQRVGSDSGELGRNPRPGAGRTRRGRACGRLEQG